MWVLCIRHTVHVLGFAPGLQWGLRFMTQLCLEKSFTGWKHITGIPASLWKDTWVFQVEVYTLHHRYDSHAHWHIPLRSDKRCVCVRMFAFVRDSFNGMPFLFNAGCPSICKPFLLRLCLVPPPVVSRSNLLFPCASHCTSPTHVGPPPQTNTCPLLVPTCPRSPIFLLSPPLRFFSHACLFLSSHSRSGIAARAPF